jgi:hypothetical protein
MSDLDIPPAPERFVVTLFVPWQVTMAQLHPVLVRYDAEIIKLPVMGKDVNPVNSPKGAPVRVWFTPDGWRQYLANDLMANRCLSR